MIETGAQLVERYEDAFSRAGGDPDSCEGVLWARRFVKDNPESTAADVITNIVCLIDTRVANHGWIIGIFRYVHGELTIEHRMIILNKLISDRIHKVVISKDFVKINMSETELDALRNAFVNTGNVRCLEVLKNA